MYTKIKDGKIKTKHEIYIFFVKYSFIKSAVRAVCQNCAIYFGM